MNAMMYRCQHEATRLHPGDLQIYGTKPSRSGEKWGSYSEVVFMSVYAMKIKAGRHMGSKDGRRRSRTEENGSLFVNIHLYGKEKDSIKTTLGRYYSPGGSP